LTQYQGSKGQNATSDVANAANNPVLSCVIDTEATLTTGNFHFVSAIAKKFPYCLAKLYIPNDYTPIILSGIVQRGRESVITKQTVGFQFHLSYFTRMGQHTSICIATGPHITVNMIVGLPFIQATGMVIDLSNHVADLRAHNTAPFPLEYRRATLHIPIVNEGAAPVNLTYYGNIIAEIQNLEKHFATAALTTTMNVNASHNVSPGLAQSLLHLCLHPFVTPSYMGPLVLSIVQSNLITMQFWGLLPFHESHLRSSVFDVHLRSFHCWTGYSS
jgi:hypothetical protein